MQLRYILLPTRGLVATEPLSAPATLRFFGSLQPDSRGPRASGLRVLDSIHANGAKLVTLPGTHVADLRRAHPGTRIVPEVFYPTARAPRPAVKAPGTRAAASGAAVVLTVQFSPDGAPLSEVDVIAFTDFAQGAGAQGRTDRDRKSVV